MACSSDMQINRNERSQKILENFIKFHIVPEKIKSDKRWTFIGEDNKLFVKTKTSK